MLLSLDKETDEGMFENLCERQLKKVFACEERFYHCILLGASFDWERWVFERVFAGKTVRLFGETFFTGLEHGKSGAPSLGSFVERQDDIQRLNLRVFSRFAVVFRHRFIFQAAENALFCQGSYSKCARRAFHRVLSSVTPCALPVSLHSFSSERKKSLGGLLWLAWTLPNIFRGQ